MMKTTQNSKNERFTRRLIKFVIVLLLSSCNANAQKPAHVPQQVFISPVMKVSNLARNDENPMRLDALSIDIKIVGKIAITTLEMTYYNPNNRIMEGEFNFPLGEGQTVSRFALDIHGQMREGSVVEKEEGRKTFEAIVRRGVDPGLLEMTEGNNFRSRVYPLPANGSRKIIIAYEQELSDKGNADLYQLPLKIESQVRQFSVHAEIVKQQVQLDNEKNELTNFEFKQWRDSYVADFSKENFTPDKQIAFTIPHLTDNATVFTAPMNDEADSWWFYVNLKPKMLNKAKELPKRIVLLWDNSNSASTRDIEKEIAVLEKYISKIGNLEIELIPFNISTEKSKHFNITNGTCEELKSDLRNMIYDGGTSLGCIDISKYTANECLLFSDGISNFESAEPRLSKIPIIAINSSVVANHSKLASIAQKAGGVYINLMNTTVNEALKLLSETNYHFISATLDNGTAWDMYPSTPCSFNNSFSMSGKMKGNQAIVNLNFGFGNQIVYTEKVKINVDKPTESSLLRRVWAEKKLNELNFDAEVNKEAITNLGKEYGIVTSNTSLIVLENLNDYLQYHIVPPKEMQAEYFQNINRTQKDETDKIKSHIDYVTNLFNARINWWNTNFQIKEEPKPKHLKAARYQAPVVLDDMADAAVFEDRVVEERAAPEAESSNEVIVVGYGVQKRSSLSGAVSSVSSNAPAASKSEETKKDKESWGNQTHAEASIQLNAWDPETPYLKVLQYSPKGQEYTTYIRLKKEYGNTPSFYTDASDFFVKVGKNDTALKILSNLAELKLEEPQLLRILGMKLQTLNCTSEAVNVFKKVLKLKGEEPQSYRDLGLAYESNGDYQLAINALYEVVKSDWNGRFPEIELIALEELNKIIANHKAKVNYDFIDGRLVKNMPLDIRVVLTWDTDDCDMDLWVTDPSGEKCFYSHKDTRIGGHISYDFTQGYGPEEFLLKKAINGEYSVQANYYGTRSQKNLAPVTLHLNFFTHYADNSEKKQAVTIRLENRQDVINVGKFSFKNN